MNQATTTLTNTVAVICLSTGAVIDAAMGPQAGKGNSELGLWRSLGAALSSGEVMLADAFYCNYFLIATLLAISRLPSSERATGPMDAETSSA